MPEGPEEHYGHGKGVYTPTKPRVVAKRPTEGSHKGVMSYGSAPRAGRGGRPKGQKNKPKGLVPLQLVEGILGALEPVLPPDQIRYLKGVIKDGAAIDTKKELDTLILLVNRSIWPALASEAIPFENQAKLKQAISNAIATGDDEPEAEPEKAKEPGLRRDVTDRLKVLNSFLTLRANIDKAEKEPGGDESQPILKLFAQRGMETRVALLVGDKPKALPAGEETIIEQE